MFWAVSILQYREARSLFRADSHFFFIKAVCHLFERNKRESIANVCRIPFLKADAEATRLRQRVAQCAHTHKQRYKHVPKHTKDKHTKETRKHFWEHAGVFANGSFHRAEDLLQTEETAQGQCRVEREIYCFFLFSFFSFFFFFLNVLIFSIPPSPCFWLEKDRQICFCS